MTSATILVVEDDRSLREGLALNLRLKGYEVDTAADGDEGMQKAFNTSPDLIILDIMMPGFTGLEIVDELRNRDEPVPVLILSARGALQDKVEGLHLGADDYMAKPFQLPELLARVKALLRRHRLVVKVEPEIQFGPVLMIPTTRTVLRHGKQVFFSTKEFDLLVLLANASGRPLSREIILNRIWGWDFDGTPRTVDNFIRSLRTKLEENPARPVYILTVRGKGYKLQTQ
jgi:two-component system, OmpR family, alkaline phosphatase synthesis response regulator PhoP